MPNQKNKKLSKIADELDALAGQYHDPSLKEIAAQLRKAVTSGKTQNESTTNEGGEEDEGEDGNGGNHPPKKGGN